MLRWECQVGVRAVHVSLCLMVQASPVTNSPLPCHPDRGSISAGLSRWAQRHISATWLLHAWDADCGNSTLAWTTRMCPFLLFLMCSWGCKEKNIGVWSRANMSSGWKRLSSCGRKITGSYGTCRSVDYERQWKVGRKWKTMFPLCIVPILLQATS